MVVPELYLVPDEERNGQRWAFWEKILSVKAGDVIIHLRGVQPNAFFVGYSQATSDGFVTNARPPEAGAWSFAENFYRADLDGYIPFQQPIRLSTIFSSLRPELENYFNQNKSQVSDHRNIFYVRQSGHLQRLNEHICRILISDFLKNCLILQNQQREN